MYCDLTYFGGDGWEKLDNESLTKPKHHFIEAFIKNVPVHLMILSWRRLNANLSVRGISIAGPQGPDGYFGDNLIPDDLGHGDCDFSKQHRESSSSLITLDPFFPLFAWWLLYPDLTLSVPPCTSLLSFCVSLPASQHCPAGVRELMSLSWIPAINQTPINRAHIKLWPNGYTGMRVVTWRARTENRGEFTKQGRDVKRCVPNLILQYQTLNIWVHN